MSAMNVKGFKGFILAFFVITSLLFLSTSSCFAQTELLFRTPPGWKTIPAGQTITLGTADVAQYHQIRVVAVGATPITILLTITEGNELVAQLDTIMLQAGQALTRVYDIPGKKITIVAKATTGSGLVQFFLYGNK
jgi:type III secretion protein HrpB1